MLFLSCGCCDAVTSEQQRGAVALLPAFVQSFVRSWAKGAPQEVKGVTLLVYCLTPADNPGEFPEALGRPLLQGLLA